MNNSSPKGANFFHSDFPDSFVNKYLSDHNGQRTHPELIRDHLQAEVESLNTTLASLFPDRPRLGTPFSNEPRELQKTVDVIKMLLTQRQRDIESKNQIYANVRRIEGQRNQLASQVEKLQRDLKRVDAERQNLAIKLKTTQKSAKESAERLTAEKDELSKKYKAIEARENQFRNQIRKQQTTIKSLQQKLGRGQEKGAFRNNFQVMQQLQTYGPTFVVVNGQHQYNQMVARTMEQNYADIVNENQFYKDTLQNIQKQLHTVLQLKKDLLRRRRGYDSEFDSNLQLTPFPPHLINLPPAFSRQGTTLLQQNVGKFKEAMRSGQIADERESQQKITCVGNVKNLIRNYKNVVQSQEQLLNRVILKAKEFKSSEMQAIQNRHAKAMDQDELQRARRFLEEQSSYLDSKNKELELTRKAMQSTIRKVEVQREEFIKRSGQNTEQLNKIKKQVEMLPAMVDQELGLV